MHRDEVSWRLPAPPTAHVHIDTTILNTDPAHGLAPRSTPTGGEPTGRRRTQNNKHLQQ